MSDRKIKLNTLKNLLAKSGNRCAFPGCTHALFNDIGQFIAQLCHIEGASPRGPRYNSNQVSQDRNSSDNLIFLCYKHHKETDDVSEYSVSKLRRIKKKHEKEFEQSYFDISTINLKLLRQNIEDFWRDARRIHDSHPLEDLKIEIDFRASYNELFTETTKILYSLSGVSSHFEHKDWQKYFEILALLIPNATTKIRTNMCQMRVLFLELQLVQKPKSGSIQTSLRRARDEFKEICQSAIYAD